MPPKGQRPAAKGKAADDNKEEVLQAIVIADTFETRFVPFTLERPRCLLPLANTPLIEYTFEFLASAGVQIVYVYAGNHVDQVETYINASRWTMATSPFREVHFIRCVASSVGDAMRDLDQKHLMNGDFLVVSGDIVSNFPVHRALKQHKDRREKDKNAIMTLLLRESKPDRRHDITGMAPTFFIDPARQRCLHYEEMDTSKPGSTKNVDPEILHSTELDVRQDLVDCRVDICTPDVLSLWSDNFDNQSPRKDFLYGILKDYELNGKTIHTYIIEDHYAYRVGDYKSYSALSRDFQTSLAGAINTENNIFGDTHYDRAPREGVRDRKVIIARGTKVDSTSILGRGTSVGSGGNIKDSIVGQRCQIGKNTQISSAYIWDDVTIGNNVVVTRAIIGNEVFIGDGCSVGEGALLSFGVKIAPGTTVAPGTRITKADQDGRGGQPNDAALVGATGEGHKYLEPADDDHFVSNASNLFYQHPELADSFDSAGSDVSDEEASSHAGSRHLSFATSLDEDEPTDRFQHDTVAVLLQHMERGATADNMQVELMGLRLSGNADENQVRKAVASATMKQVQNEVDAGQSPEAAAKKVFSTYHTLIRREGTEQSTEEQVAFLVEAQRAVARRKDIGKTFAFALQQLYEIDVIEEEGFLEWWSDEKSSADPDMVAVREQATQFIEWLETAESEDDDDEDEDSE